MSNTKRSLVKGDVSKEVIPFDNGSHAVIEYLKDKNSEPSDEFGRFTAKFRRVTLHGKLGVLSERVELNPFYDKEAAKLNDKWQKEYSLEIIHQGLSLKEIKKKVENGESYLVIIWKKGCAPLPVDLGFHKKITLSLIDNAGSVEDLTFNVINIVRSMKG
ncbi:MAG: hypothetical protein E7Z75_09135 [Methanobrevibacter olleyae]|uniref:Uncharacterized protein n=1 Tax=Methanobrevibacter olleyae TaxID=294671 RepID=A0A8T3VZC3_METOL|nr:hypothetical protein [Methanobrevibacter olleyae]